MSVSAPLTICTELEAILLKETEISVITTEKIRITTTSSTRV